MTKHICFSRLRLILLKLKLRFIVFRELPFKLVILKQMMVINEV